MDQQKALSFVSNSIIRQRPTLIAFGNAACRGRFGKRQVPTKLLRRHLEVEARQYGGRLVLTPENR